MPENSLNDGEQEQLDAKTPVSSASTSDAAPESEPESATDKLARVNPYADKDEGVPLIKLIDVCKTYDLGEIQVHALRDANLTIRKGEFISLIGPSGSGKSTLMNTLGCLDRPTSGSFLLDDQEMANLSRDGRAKIRNRHIGFVFQNFNLLNRTTALENVELPMLYTPGSTKRKRRKKATDLLKLVGLADRMDHHPSQLSGGQQQRVAIARALANDPDILMGDEPTGNLDTRTSRDVIRLFRDLNQKTDLTIILVTHDQNVARNADRVVVMSDGEIIEDTSDFVLASAALDSAAAILDVDIEDSDESDDGSNNGVTE